jgi:hypothetical protein
VSAGAIFQEALRVLRRAQLPEECERDLTAVLEAGRPGPLPLLYEAGHEAGLDRVAILARATAIYLAFCAGNLADDLADGDVDYLDEPVRLAPGAQYVLQTLAFAELAAAGLPAAVLERGARTLVASAAWQQVEVRTRAWTAARYREVAEAIAGRQWEAYLMFLWHGTPLLPLAAEIGVAAGLAGLVAEDFRSGDARFATLPAADQELALGWVREALLRLGAHELRCVQAIRAGVEARLGAGR